MFFKIPALLLKQLYTFGGLANANGDVRLALKNRLSDATVTAIRRIEAEVNPENLASCALLLRVGFVFEGRLRKRWVAKGNAYDTNIYSWLAEDRLAASLSSPGSGDSS